MKKTLECCLAVTLLVCASTAWAGDVREQRYEVGTDVDAQGQITATQIDKQVPASIAALLTSSMRQWHFVPAQREGKPVPAHTFVSIKLRAAADAAGHYRMRISYEGNGPRVFTSLPAPKYPRQGVAFRQSEFVALNAIAEPDGHLSHMVVTSQFKDWPMHSWFENSVLTAARHWRLEPEMVDGTAVATHVRVPVTFTLDNSNFTPEQKRILRSAVSKQDAEDAQLAGTDISLPSEQTVALDSPLKPSHVADITSAP